MSARRPTDAQLLGGPTAETPAERDAAEADVELRDEARRAAVDPDWRHGHPADWNWPIR